ncbi:MAG: hypothetical protein QMB79_03660 [Cloacibacterium sp.]
MSRLQKLGHGLQIHDIGEFDYNKKYKANLLKVDFLLTSHGLQIRDIGKVLFVVYFVI